MDDVVCPECRGATMLLSASLTSPSSRTDRTWRECATCGWESGYEDVVHRL